MQAKYNIDAKAFFGAEPVECSSEQDKADADDGGLLGSGIYLAHDTSVEKVKGFLRDARCAFLDHFWNRRFDVGDWCNLIADTLPLKTELQDIRYVPSPEMLFPDKGDRKLGPPIPCGAKVAPQGQSCLHQWKAEGPVQRARLVQLIEGRVTVG